MWFFPSLFFFFFEFTSFSHSVNVYRLLWSNCIDHMWISGCWMFVFMPVQGIVINSPVPLISNFKQYKLHWRCDGVGRTVGLRLKSTLSYRWISFGCVNFMHYFDPLRSNNNQTESYLFSIRFNLIFSVSLAFFLNNKSNET